MWSELKFTRKILQKKKKQHEGIWNIPTRKTLVAVLQRLDRSQIDKMLLTTFEAVRWTAMNYSAQFAG